MDVLKFIQELNGLGYNVHMNWDKKGNVVCHLNQAQKDSEGEWQLITAQHQASNAEEALTSASEKMKVALKG